MIADFYVTLQEAARMKGVDPVTIRSWITLGKLRAEKVGREVLIRRDDLSSLTRSTRGRVKLKRLAGRRGVDTTLFATC